MLDAHVREVRAAMDCVRELDALARGLERAGRRHMQRVGFLRFNPFRDAGGDQSFALALADSEGNGFVVSSLHSRDVTRVYGKPLRRLGVGLSADRRRKAGDREGQDAA